MKISRIFLIVLTAVVVGLGLFLRSPYQSHKKDDILSAAQAYDVRIIRDQWGVAHIFGKTDPDTSFGLGYSHAEDDWETIQETVMTARGEVSKYKGFEKNLVGLEAPVQDYLYDLFRVREAVEAKIDTEVSPEARAMAKAYAEGLNLWGVENPDRVLPGILPVTDKDIIAGYTWATPFFYRVDEALQVIFAEGDAPPVGPYSSANLDFSPAQAVMGSNAFAIAPSRSEDGHTRLVVNSHQPFTGPYAWFEAHVVSDEGLNLAGGGFPGTPVLAQGVTPTHGWAHTVNKPDLIDIYKLETDRDKNPKQYKLDGEWRDFEIQRAHFRIKLAGPISMPVFWRKTLWSEHGPVLETDHGFYALRFSGLQEVRALDQWYAMSKASTLEEWQKAINMNGLLSFNIVYAHKDGHIGTVYNAKMPKRIEGPDWKGVLPGTTSDLIWDSFHDVSALPQIYNPESGWLFSANSSPFFVTDEGYNNLREDYPVSFGIEPRMTNRARRSLALFAPDLSISKDELLTYRADTNYEPGVHLWNMVGEISELTFDDTQLIEAQKIIAAWDGNSNIDNRQAALVILTGRYAYGLEFIDERMPLAEALKKAAQDLITVSGRIDPKWGDVNRLRRGTVDLPLDGGPDTLRAIYGDAENFVENKGFTATGGDTHIMFADWNEDGELSVQSIHQFGAATLDESSPHYSDQAHLFARGEYKQMPMTLEEVLPLAQRDYRPGKAEQK